LRVDSLVERYRNLSLSTKFALHIIVSIALLFAALMPAVVYLQTHAVLEETKKRGLQLTKVFAHASVQAVVADDFLMIRQIINSIASEPDVVHAMILDGSGRVIAHSDMKETGRVYTDPLSVRAASMEGPLVQEVWQSDRHAYDFAVPIYVLNEPRAVARVVISLERELATIRQTRNLILALGALALGGGLALATWQARSVTRPVGQLLIGAREIAAGNLDRKIQIQARDEVGQLGEAFNRMGQSLKALWEIDREISSTLNLDSVLRTIAHHARVLLKAETAYVAPCNPTTGVATIVAGAGDRVELLRGIEIVPGRGAGGYVLATGEPLIIQDYVRDPRITHEFDELVLRAGVTSALVVPIRLKEKTIGLLYVSSSRPTAFTGQDREILMRLADQAAIALDNARLYQDLRESHEQLLGAQEQLVRKTRMAAIGEIAAAVAHEARNPLGALSNCVQLLRENPHLSGEDRELLDVMRTETQRLNEIVSDFLAFGRPRPPHFEVVNLHEVIDETFGLLRRDDRWSPTIAFIREFDGSLPEVGGDRDQLRQVFWNLFLNAAQAMGDHGELRVDTRRLGNQVEIAVRDTGPGIAMGALAKIFEPFYSTKGGGSGLGLPIVRRIVEEHRGHITVDSKEGVGACFLVSLPLDQEVK